MPGSNDPVTGIPELWLWEAIESAAEVDAFPMTVPEGTQPPFVMFGRASTQRTRGLEEGGLDQTIGSFSVQIYADSYREAKVIAKAIADAVVDFSGSDNGVTISDALLEDESDGEPVFLEGRDRPTYSIDQTFQIMWVEE